MVKKIFPFVMIFIALFSGLLNLQLPEQISFFALFLPTDHLDLLLLQSYTLPRIAIALLAGGILGFSSLLLQQVMANPLASDNTLGISSGAQFSLFLTAIFTPEWLANGSSIVAFLGALFSLILVLSLAIRKTISPLLLILAGLVVNLYFGAFSSMMMLFYPEESRGLAQWGAGSLVQQSWHDSLWLFFQALPAFLVITLLIRPFTLLSLNEANAQSLGVPVTKLRILGVLVSSFLIASVVSAVGMLGFVGLAAASIVRQMGARTFKSQLFSAFVIGALLLAITDICLQLLAHFYAIHLPTGAITALLGTPLLLWLMFKSLPNTGRLIESNSQKFHQINPLVCVALGGSLFIAISTALWLGNGANDWEFYHSETLIALRAPRILVALSAGVLLAIAGVILQRLTQNPMASPELLGVSSGTSIGILAVLFLFSAPQSGYIWFAGGIGAFIALAVLITINQRNGMLPEKVLLTGISLSALFDTLQRLAIASGSPKVNQLIAWTSGSTLNATNDLAMIISMFSLLLLLVSFIFGRWLDLFSLQTTMAQSLGVDIKHARWILILFSAFLTAIATLIIGPLSFIGLLVPQLAKMLGAYKAKMQLLLSALLGGLIMVLADWFGRQIMFPYEIPAGLVATLIGGSYFLLMIRRI